MERLKAMMPGRKPQRRLHPNEEAVERTQEEEIARNLWAHHHMLPPASNNKKRWDTFIVLLVIYNCWSIPLVLGFNLYNYDNGNYNPGHMTFDYLVDCCFALDIFLTFRTTYYDNDNELVLDKKIIKKTYMRVHGALSGEGSSFWIDMLATIPFELVGVLYPPNKVLIRFKLLRLLRCSKPLRNLDVHNNVVRVTQMLGIFIVYAHMVGSLWWSLGVMDTNRDPPGTPPGTTWVVRANVCDSVDESEHYCEDTPMIQKYMSSLYWSLTTLIKTPWVHPDTILEKVFASVIVISGAIFFAAILGNITAMINSFDKSNAQLRDVMSTLHRLIGKYDVPLKLQKRVFMYVQTQWSTTKGLDNQRILAKVPPSLRGDILEAIYADLLQASPLFQNFSIECVRLMLSKLHSEVCLAKETLIAAGQLCSEVYIIARGVLRVTPGDDTTTPGARKQSARKMLFRVVERPGALIGMRDPFEKDYRYPFQVVAVKQAQLLVLSAKDLMDVFAMDNRGDIEVICDVLDKEFNDVNTALVKQEDGKNARRSHSVGAAKRRSSAGAAGSASSLSGMSDTEEVHARIGVIEETIRQCDNELTSIQEHLQLLPRLCDLLHIDLPPISGGKPGDVSPTTNGG